MPKANYGAGASGALSGASTGFAVGGPVGAAIGGTIGGVAGLFGGGRKKKKKRSTLDKRQQMLNEQQHDSILGKGPLADLYNYDPEQANNVFDQTIARAQNRNFKEETVPGITGAFRSQGLENSSYLGGALSKAGRDVSENLAGLRSKYLYDEQNNARSAKRNAVENLQNRQTFAYDTAAPSSGGSSIDSILKSISPEAIEGIKDFIVNKTPGGA